ncbi:MAG TPA: hypothetical protein VGQ42_12105 [Candidatus Dormibacteraeota bacterium]|nr:hypothetical protein [Candidatus Dormibacteraeota bacterium]
MLHYEEAALEEVHAALADALTRNVPLAAANHTVIASAIAKGREVGQVLSDANTTPKEKVDTLGDVILMEDLERLVADLEAFPLAGDLSRSEEEEPVETAGTISPVEMMSMVGAKGPLRGSCDDYWLRSGQHESSIATRLLRRYDARTFLPASIDSP